MKPEVPTQWGPDKRSWHLDKTISVGHLVSTLVIAISVFSWAVTLDKRVEQNSIAIVHLKEQQANEQKRLQELRQEIKQDLRDINQKLDRLIESQGKR
jgi:chaperonin cofactor prefoldin